MIAPDTSVVIAALVPWHEAHARARAVLGAERDRCLIAHVAFEATSSLSRMPRGQRVAATVVHEALESMFPSEWLAPTPAESRAALERAVGAGVRGGALYDALIASTAAAAGVRLISLDRRALPVYEQLGTGVELLVV